VDEDLIVKHFLAAMLAATSLIPAHALAQQAAPAARPPADDIFLDHPSQDRNATVMPAPDAQPVKSFFNAHAITDASVAQAADGRWFVTGTVIRDGRRDGIQLWSSADDGKSWAALGVVHGAGHRYVAPDIQIRGDVVQLAFADDNGCAHIARGSLANLKAGFTESPCLVSDVADASSFIDNDGTVYLLWNGGNIARVAADFSKLAEAPRFLKPDPALFKTDPPAGKDWPVRLRVGKAGASMFRDGDQYVVTASEVTGRMRTATDDVYMATGPTPYGPFSKRMLAVPHAGQTNVVRTRDGKLVASYNPRCEDDFAMFCEQVGLVPLERAPDGRIRQAASVLTENSAVADRLALITDETMRDPSATLGGDGAYYLVGTQKGFGFQYPEGGVNLYRSTDLKTWTSQNKMIFDWKGLGYTFKDVAELWAPEIHWSARDKTYYLAFSVMERGVGGKSWLFRSTSGKAIGPYVNTRDSYFVEGIDAFPFEDESGFYLLWGGGRIGKLNAKRSGFEGDVKRLVDIDGENVGYEGNGLIKVGGTYFLTGAEWNGPLRTDGTYDMMYGTSKSLMGPYSKRRLAVPHGGHGTAFRDAQGHFWYTMFGNDTTAPWRRHFGLVPIEISEDGIRVPQIER
jgi:xylan 1,4-beta-xylosidase